MFDSVGVAPPAASVLRGTMPNEAALGVSAGASITASAWSVVVVLCRSPEAPSASRASPEPGGGKHDVAVHAAIPALPRR